MQTTRLLQIASLVPHPPLRPLVPTQEAPRQEKNSEQEKSEGENSQGENSEEENSEEEKVQTKGTGRVESRFFYVVRDMDLGPEDRRIKVGVSGNLEATLRTYRRRIRNDHLLVTADCGTERGARRVERHMKGVFSAKRDHEIYLVGVHEVIRELSRLKFRQGPDGIFRE